MRNIEGSYLIMKGDHYQSSVLLPKIICDESYGLYECEILFHATPEELAETNHNHFNKIIGYRSMFGARFNSTRIGWRICNSSIQFCIMNEYKKMITYSDRIEHYFVSNSNDYQQYRVKIRFTLTPSGILVTKDDNALYKANPFPEHLSFYSLPYFGGKEKADRDYKFIIKKVVDYYN